MYVCIYAYIYAHWSAILFAFLCPVKCLLQSLICSPYLYVCAHHICFVTIYHGTNMTPAELPYSAKEWTSLTYLNLKHNKLMELPGDLLKSWTKVGGRDMLCEPLCMHYLTLECPALPHFS